MAEGFVNALLKDKYRAYSAGTFPAGLNPLAVKVMAEEGIDISHHRSKNIEEFKDFEFDFVITVCDSAKETCPFFPGKNIIHKDFFDPAGYEGSYEDKLNVFRKVRDEIKNWILQTFKS